MLIAAGRARLRAACQVAILLGLGALLAVARPPAVINPSPETVPLYLNLERDRSLLYESTARGSGKIRKIKVEAFRFVDDERENFKVPVREGWR